MIARARSRRKIRPDLLFVALQRSQSIITSIRPFPGKDKPSCSSAMEAFGEIGCPIQSKKLPDRGNEKLFPDGISAAPTIPTIPTIPTLTIAGRCF